MHPSLSEIPDRHPQVLSDREADAQRFEEGSSSGDKHIAEVKGWICVPVVHTESFVLDMFLTCPASGPLGARPPPELPQGGLGPRGSAEEEV
jgi:hypothetical protein